MITAVAAGEIPIPILIAREVPIRTIVSIEATSRPIAAMDESYPYNGCSYNPCTQFRKAHESVLAPWKAEHDRADKNGVRLHAALRADRNRQETGLLVLVGLELTYCDSWG